MATPRKKHFRVGDSILREPWRRELKLACVLLQAHLNTRWRRDGVPNTEAGRCLLSRGALQDITGKSRVRSGFALLRELAELVSITVSLEGEFVSVDWPKFPEFQLLDTRGRAEPEPGAEPHPTPAPTPAPEEEQEPAYGGSAEPDLAGEGLGLDLDGTATRTRPSAWANLLAAKWFRKDRAAAIEWLVDVLPEVEAAAERDLAKSGHTPATAPKMFHAAIKAGLHARARRHRDFDGGGRARVVRPTGVDDEAETRPLAALGVTR